MSGILTAVAISSVPYPAKYDVQPSPHITLHYGCDLTPDIERHVGTKFFGVATDYGDNGEIEALLMEIPPTVPFAHEVPHLTLSHKAWVYPVTAAKMLKAVSLDAIDEPNPIEFEIKYVKLEAGTPKPVVDTLSSKETEILERKS
jgi:hypothetical protein